MKYYPDIKPIKTPITVKSARDLIFAVFRNRDNLYPEWQKEMEEELRDDPNSRSLLCEYLCLHLYRKEPINSKFVKYSHSVTHNKIKHRRKLRTKQIQY